MPPIVQHFLPHSLLSKIAHLLANCKVTWIKNYLIKYFISRYPIDMSEAKESIPQNYCNFNAFFTRALLNDIRPIDNDQRSIVSPVDGTISQFGGINHGRIIQAKGHDFSLSDLLGNQQELATTFLAGKFMTVYLAPYDYHRVHMPFTGALEQMICIPGKLFSVSNKTADYIPNLFARNERIVSIFQTEVGKMAVILVGAMIVGSIETVWAGTISPPHNKAIKHIKYTNNSLRKIILKKGEEMGRFKLGSTVILLFEKNSIAWQNNLTINHSIKMGQAIGKL